jgi:hypothetical protein
MLLIDGAIDFIICGSDLPSSSLPIQPFTSDRNTIGETGSPGRATPGEKQNQGNDASSTTILGAEKNGKLCCQVISSLIVGHLRCCLIAEQKTNHRLSRQLPATQRKDTRIL